MKWGRRKNKYGPTKVIVVKKKTLAKKIKGKALGREVLTRTELGKRVEAAKQRKYEREREAKFVDEYKHRDKMSVQAIRARTNRLKAEQEFRDLVYRPERERAEQAQRDAEAAAKAKAEKRARNLRRLQIAATIGANLPYEQMLGAKPDSSKFEGGSSDKLYRQAVQAYNKKVKAFKQVKSYSTATNNMLNALNSNKKKK